MSDEGSDAPTEDVESGRKEPASQRRVGERIRDAVARRLSIDSRALAVLRISLGGLLLLDLLLRARSLRAHYTDAGALPRSALVARYGALGELSLHAASGDPWFVALLFLVTGGFAVALALGYRTRAAIFGSWLLLASLHARNPLVLNAGDSLLRRLLFWSVFLPLGARWSIDALRRSKAGSTRTTGQQVATVASAALLVQIVLVYTVNGLFKLRGDLWRSGEAIRYIFGLDSLTVLLGDTLAEFPALLVALDRVWFAMVLSSVGLILLAGRLRAAFAAAFAGAHLGMFLTLRIGIFPLVSIAALSVFVPPPVWDAIEGRLSRGPARNAATRIGHRIDRVLPGGHGITSSWMDRPAVRVWGGRTVSVLVAVLLALILVWNAATLGHVPLPAEDAPVSTREHRWDMFAPRPLGVDAWFVAPGLTDSGDRVDALWGEDVDRDRPPDIATAYPSSRWRKYLMDLRNPGYAGLRPAFGAYLCQRYDARHTDSLVNVSLYVIEQPTRLDGPEPVRRVELWSGTCEG